MNIKKVVAATLILSSMTAVSASAAEFNDIKGHWAEDVINELADMKILYTVFRMSLIGRNCNACKDLKMALGTSVLPMCRLRQRMS